MAKKNSF